MNKTKRSVQSGFTLIEALIAFLVLTIGLVGAGLFHAELIGESGTSKTRALAVKLVERGLEEQRVALVPGDYTGLDTGGVYAPLETYTSSTAVYTLTYRVQDVSDAAPSVSPNFENYKRLDVKAAWSNSDGAAQEVELSTLFTWLNPAKSLDNSDQAGVGSGSNVAAIQRPDGAAVAVARTTVTQTHSAAEIGEVVQIDGTNIYAVKIADGAVDDTLVTAIELKNTASQIMTVTGDLYIKTLAHSDALTASPDVLTSAGGGCVVFQTAAEIAAGETNLAHYTCLFGEGWFGNIGILGADSRDKVCPSSARSYKYLIVDPDEYTWTATAAVPSLPAELIGQSGLVRFTNLSGSGPFIATPGTEPDNGYFELFEHVESASIESFKSVPNRSGNVLVQHFVVIKKPGANDCASGSWSDGDGFIYDHSTTSAGASTTIDVSSDSVILGYVFASVEFTSVLHIDSTVTQDLGVAEALQAGLVIGVNPDPSVNTVCTQTGLVLGDGDLFGLHPIMNDVYIDFACPVTVGWTGDVIATFDNDDAGSTGITVANSPFTVTTPVRQDTELLAPLFPLELECLGSCTLP
jgi:hypothetical protein